MRHSPRPTATALLACLALGAGLSGCKKSRECNALADVTHRRGAEIARIEERASDTPTPLAADMKELAEVAEEAATEVEALHVEAEDVAPPAKAYEETAHELAVASRDFSGLMESLEGHRSSGADVVKDFEHTGDSLVKACETASLACNALGDVLRKQPEAPSQKELPKVLADYLLALGELDLEDNTVQRAVDARIAATRSYKLLIEKGASLNEDIDEARSRIHEVVDRHNALIGELNVACLGRSPETSEETAAE